MRSRGLLLALVLLAAALPAPAAGQDDSPVRLEIELRLRPAESQVEVVFSVRDPGPLRTLQLGLGSLETLEGAPSFEGSWRQEDGRAVADLEETPQAVARWTADGTVRAQTLEGEGHTTYVGEDFAVVKAGDLVPDVRYSFPQDRPPAFETELGVAAPEGWSVEGPWLGTGDAFRLERPLPRGFLAAGPDLERTQLGSGDDAYDILRVAGAREDATTERILLQARSYLGGVYGKSTPERFIVVAPSPMFRGGLGSPAGVFLHDDADASVVAHELVHAYQTFRFSRAPGEATIWLAEGSAVVHGALLEVAAGAQTREEARSFLERRHETAREEHAVALTSAVYGSGNERAAYTKGAVVVTALDDWIREASDNQYTLSDVLRELNRRGSDDDNFVAATEGVAGLVSNRTNRDPSPFFDEFVHGSSVPELGSVFPGQASVRLLGTEPSPPVADRPFEVIVRLTNLDTRNTTVDAPVEVDGTERGRLVATLAPGATVEATAEVEPLPRGSYEIRIRGATATVEVQSPADPTVNVTVWPRQPRVGANVTVGARVGNAGEAPFRAPVSVEVDGRAVLEREVDVAADDVRTISRTLAPLSAGIHEVRVLGPEGRELASRSIAVREAPDEASASAAGAAVVLTLAGLAARLARAREPR